MDFVEKELVLLYCCWFSLGVFGNIVAPFPENKVVLAGTRNATLFCVSSINANRVFWSFKPVGSNRVKTVKSGAVIIDRNYDMRIDNDAKTITLIIKIANSTTAGLYTCLEANSVSVQLIVLSEAPSCDIDPTETQDLQCNDTLTLSCTIGYAAHASYAEASLIWSTVDSSDGLVGEIDSSMFNNITTITSTLNVTIPKNTTSIPVYRCNATFKVADGLPATFVKNNPDYYSTCEPFDSPIAVPCAEETKKDEHTVEIKTTQPSDERREPERENKSKTIKTTKTTVRPGVSETTPESNSTETSRGLPVALSERSNLIVQALFVAVCFCWHILVL